MKKNKDFAEYFIRIYNEHARGRSQGEVGKDFGISQGAVSKMCSGESIPSDEMAKKIAAAWNLDLEEFMGVIYNSRREAGARYFRASQRRAEEETKPRLPITAAAGVLSDYLGGTLAHECEQVPVIRGIPDYDFTVIVKGNSMEPIYQSGDEIACKKVESVVEWGKTYVLATRDGAVLKRIYEGEDGVRCVSYNSTEYPDFYVKGEDILGIYRVVALVRI
jgi:transcriptional regulator with XRE-family HTH domain